MTAPDRQDDNKTTAAKALFIGFFAAALGWAGVLVAAVAVATEQTWSRGRPERDRAAQRRSSWLDTQRDWLAADHGQRMARAAAYRQWLADGADPATKPARPGRARRAGTGLRRALAHIAVAAADFASGFRDGWRAADERRKQGALFGDIRKARPGSGRTPEPGNRSNLHRTNDENLHQNTNADETGKGGDGVNPTPKPDHIEDPSTPDKGEPMSTASPATQAQPAPAPAAESNATVLARRLDTIAVTVTAMTSETDQLHAVVTTLTQQITAAADLAHSAGMPTAAIHAVDAARHATSVISGRLDDFATGATATSEQLTAAINGLKPVQQAEDTLHAAGADGRALNTAAA